MSRNRITLTGLMALIALLAAEFAALRSGSRLWFSTIYTATVGLLLVATLAARSRRGAAGAFWFGFAVFGWAYLLLVLGPWSSSLFRNVSDNPRANPDLLTTRMIESFLYLIRGSAAEYPDVDEFAECTTGIAHLMLVLVFATLGGFIASVLRTRRTRAARTGAGVSPVPKGRTIVLLGLAGLVLLVGAASYSSHPTGPYFPDGTFYRDEDRNRFIVTWYSKHLRAMREPSLWGLSRSGHDATAYRLLWLPSFHHPACVRITKVDGAATLRVVVLDGHGGYEPGQIAIDKEIKLSAGQWDQIERSIDQAGFWSLPTRSPEDEGVTDGDGLILEAARGGKYHIVDRWLPDAKYLTLCHFLFDLTGVNLRKTLDGYHGSPSN